MRGRAQACRPVAKKSRADPAGLDESDVRAKVRSASNRHESHTLILDPDFLHACALTAPLLHPRGAIACDIRPYRAARPA